MPVIYPPSKKMMLYIRNSSSRKAKSGKKAWYCRNSTKDHISRKHPMETSREETVTTLGNPKRTLMWRKCVIPHLAEVLKISQHQRPLLPMLRKPQQSHVSQQSHPSLNALDDSLNIWMIRHDWRTFYSSTLFFVSSFWLIRLQEHSFSWLI